MSFHHDIPNLVICRMSRKRCFHLYRYCGGAFRSSVPFCIHLNDIGFNLDFEILLLPDLAFASQSFLKAFTEIIHQQYKKCYITVNFSVLNIVFLFFCENFSFIDIYGGSLWKQCCIDLLMPSLPF